ncbi:MAG: CsbD family protein [Beijerinckiaceae bacterium]
MSSTTDKVKGKANELAGAAKQKIGEWTDNKKMQAEGAAQEAKGETQQAVGNAKEGVKKAADSVNDTVQKNL